MKPTFDYEPSQYAVETLDFVLLMDQYITRNYGTRCPDYVPGCAICGMWKMRDGIADFVCE